MLAIPNVPDPLALRSTPSSAPSSAHRMPTPPKRVPPHAEQDPMTMGVTDGIKPIRGSAGADHGGSGPKPTMAVAHRANIEASRSVTDHQRAKQRLTDITVASRPKSPSKSSPRPPCTPPHSPHLTVEAPKNYRDQTSRMGRNSQSGVRSLLRIQAVRCKAEGATHPAAVQHAGFRRKDSPASPARPPTNRRRTAVRRTASPRAGANGCLASTSPIILELNRELALLPALSPSRQNSTKQSLETLMTCRRAR